MKAAVDFETIETVPVSTLFYQFFCFREIGGNELVVAKEEPNADEGQRNVDS